MKNDHLNIDQKLLVLYLLNEISSEGRRKVEAWLDASEENRNDFNRLRKTWELTGNIDPNTVAFDTNHAWEKLNNRIITDESQIPLTHPIRTVGATRGRPSYPRGRPSLPPIHRFILSTAAILVLLLASVLIVKFIRNSPVSGTMILASYAIPVQDTLTDGSTVVLNANTELSVPKKFAEKSRTVKLRGEAFFEVQPDREKPFVIDAGLGQVTVLGTSFHVRAYAGTDLEVYVESGRVELSAVDPVTGDTAKMVLKAGERGRIKPGTNAISKPAEIGPDELFWANKKLIFQETKLSLVFDLLKKHYDASIEVQDTTIRNCLLSATFTDEPIDQILEVIAASFNLTLSVENEKYFIKGKGCGNEE